MKFTRKQLGLLLALSAGYLNLEAAAGGPHDNSAEVAGFAYFLYGKIERRKSCSGDEYMTVIKNLALRANDLHKSRNPQGRYYCTPDNVKENDSIIGSFFDYQGCSDTFSTKKQDVQKAVQEGMLKLLNREFKGFNISIEKK